MQESPKISSGVKTPFVYLIVIVLVFGLAGFLTPNLVKATGGDNDDDDLPSCTLQPQAGRIIVNFSGKLIRSDQGQSAATSGPVGKSIPSGVYDVTLVSYDDHVHKTTTQTDERWHVILKNSSGQTVATSNSIADLPNNLSILTQKVNTALNIGQNVSSVTAFHAVYPSSAANSIVPICAVFDDVTPPPAPAPTADIKADNSDGPVTIAYNTSAVISWSSVNASSCSVSPSGWTGLSGSQSTGNLVTSRTYQLSCSGPGGSVFDSVTVTVANPSAVTADIKADGSDGPILVPYNGSAAITWTSAGASSCFVSPAGWTGASGSQPSGNLQVSHTYQLSCNGPGGSAFDSVTVNVGPPPAVTADIKADNSDGPVTIPYDSPADITWTSTGASSCSVSPTGWTGLTGSQSTGNLTFSRTYQLSCNGPNGSAFDSVTVEIEDPDTPAADIKANGSDGPVAVPYDGSATITWTSVNASTCFVSPSGWTGVSGSQSTGNLVTVRTYQLSCSGPGGSVFDSVTINIESPDIVSADIKADGSDGPVNIPFNGSATITWISVNAASCSVSPGGWTGTSGSQSTGNLTFSQTYHLSCNGPNGSAFDSVVVNVGSAALPTVDIKADGSDGPITISSNASVNISWTSANANSCSISPTGLSGISGSQSVSTGNVSRTYTVTCNGVGGTAVDSVTVYIQQQYYQAYYQQPYYQSYYQPYSYQNYYQPTVNLTAGAGVINQGDSATLYWTSTNANYCNASGSGDWSGPKAMDGSQLVRPSFTTTYTIVCYNTSGGSATDSATVSVVPRPVQPVGQVLGAATVVTGPEDVLFWVFFLGILGAATVYFVLFRYRFGRGEVVWANPDSEFKTALDTIKNNELKADC